MNMYLAREAILSNFTTKVMAIIFGAFFWHFFSLERDVILLLNVPVCFNECLEQIKEAPEYVAIKLSARRKDFYALDTSCLAVHIQHDDLKNQKNCILINPEKLLLPQQIRLVSADPLYIVVERDIEQI